MFNRDEPDREKLVHVTVKASDHGKPPLEDVCTIAVKITDINDNPPIFDRANYDVPVAQVCFIKGLNRKSSRIIHLRFKLSHPVSHSNKQTNTITHIQTQTQTSNDGTENKNNIEIVNIQTNQL